MAEAIRNSSIQLDKICDSVLVRSNLLIPVVATITGLSAPIGSIIYSADTAKMNVRTSTGFETVVSTAGTGILPFELDTTVTPNIVRYVAADVTTPGNTDFIISSVNPGSTEGAGRKIFFDGSLGSFYAGSASGTQFDVGERAANSVVFGTDAAADGNANSFMFADTNGLDLAGVLPVTAAANQAWFKTTGGFTVLANVANTAGVTVNATDLQLLGATNRISTEAASGANIVLAPDGAGRVRLNANPTVALDAATKQYVDGVAAGLDPKESCRFGTLAPIVGVYAAGGGTAGTGAFTGVDFTDAADFDIGAFTVAIGDRILVKDQADTLQNGIYRCTLGGAAGTMERDTDQDGTPAGEVSSGNYTFVELGPTLASRGFVLTGDGVLTLNVDTIVWVSFTVLNLNHSSLNNLLVDDHTQYALLAGRGTGQTLIGGTAAGNDLTFESTSNAAKGTIISLDPIECDDLDARTATTLLLGKATATRVEIADTGVTTEVEGPLTVEGSIDIEAAGTLTLGPATATRVEIADTGVITDIEGPLEVEGSIDTAAAGTLTLGPATATRVEIADTGVTTEVEGPLTVEGSIDIEAAGTLTLGPATATRVEIADTGVITDIEGPLEVEGSIDTAAAGTLTLGPATATRVEIADTGVTTEVEGPLTVEGSIDIEAAGTLTLGPATATRVEIADTGVITDIEGPLEVEGSIDTAAAATLTLGPATATKVEIADTGVETEVQGTLDVLEAATMVSITIDGDRSAGPELTGSYFHQDTNTFTDNDTLAAGTAAAFVQNSFEGVLVAASNAGVTITDSATVYIDGPPTTGGNPTLTNPYALWIDSGNQRIDGAIMMLEGADAPQVAEIGSVYTKDVSTVTELFFRDSDGSIVQITSGGSLNSGAIAPVNVVSEAATTTLLDSETYINADTSGGVDVTLSLPASATNGQQHTIKHAVGGTAGLLFVTASGAETIDDYNGGTTTGTIIIDMGGSYRFTSDGAGAWLSENMSKNVGGKRDNTVVPRSAFSGIFAGGSGTGHAISTLGDNCAILAGDNNSITAGDRGTVVCGIANVVSSSGANNCILSGTTGAISGTVADSCIGAGSSNTISGGFQSFVTGGSNTMSGTGGQSAILAGLSSTMSSTGDRNAIVGCSSGVITGAAVTSSVISSISSIIGAGTVAASGCAIIGSNGSFIGDAAVAVVPGHCGVYSAINSRIGNFAGALDRCAIMGGDSLTIGNLGVTSRSAIVGGDGTNIRLGILNFAGGGINCVMGDVAGSFAPTAGCFLGSNTCTIGTAATSFYSSVISSISSTISAAAGTTNECSIIACTGSTISDGAVTGDRCAIVGGSTCKIAVSGNSSDCVVCGGNTNDIENGVQSGIFAGGGNTINTGATRSGICGGIFNVIAGDDSFIGGGDTNVITLTGDNCAIVGGNDNSVAGSGSGMFMANNCTIDSTTSNIFMGGRINDGVGIAETWAWGDQNATTFTTTVSNCAYFLAESGGLIVLTNAGRSTGGRYTAGTAWTSLSDWTMKENFVRINDYDDILERFVTVPIYSFNYHGTPEERVMRGHLAQDWLRVFPEFETDIRANPEKLSIDGDDVSTAMAASIIALCKRNVSLQNRVESLESENTTLKSGYEDLLSRVIALES